MLKVVSDLKDKAAAGEVIAALNRRNRSHQRTQPAVALEAIFARDELREAAGCRPATDEISVAQVWAQDGIQFGPLLETDSRRETSPRAGIVQDAHPERRRTCSAAR
jgi:hypothetical protein